MILKELDPNLLVLELSQLQEVTGDENTLILELLDLYVSDTGERVKALEENLSQERWEGALREAHTIKGSSANVGAQRMQHCAHFLERHLRESSSPTPQSFLTRMQQEFSDFQNAVDNFRKAVAG